MKWWQMAIFIIVVGVLFSLAFFDFSAEENVNIGTSAYAQNHK